MKAAVYRRYGPPSVVHIEDLPKPEPRPDEVLIKIRASTVSSADWRARSLQVPAGFGFFARPVFGMLGPRKIILGTELSGEIEAVGKDVKRFKPGDAVFAFPGFALGCHAEYRIMRESDRLLPKPSALSFEEAAALSFGGSTALYFLRNLAKLRAGEKVLIIGATGAVGSAAVQMAKHLGASVTGVASHANAQIVKALGADTFIDYQKGPYLDASETYDVIFDTVGATDFQHCAAALKSEGRLLMAAASLPQILRGSWTSATGKKKVISGNARELLEDLVDLKALAETSAFKPLLDRSFPLEHIVDAHAYAETGRKRGSVVITMP